MMMLTAKFTALATILGAGLVANARPWNYANAGHAQADSLIALEMTVPGSVLHLHTNSLPEQSGIPTTMTSLASTTLATLASPVSMVSPHNARGQDDVLVPVAQPNPATMSAPSASTPSTLPKPSAVDATPSPSIPAPTPTDAAPAEVVTPSVHATNVPLTLTPTSSSHATTTTYPPVYDPSKNRPAGGYHKPQSENGADNEPEDDGGDWDSDDDDYEDGAEGSDDKDE